jgi:hypothetical protein
VLRGTQTMEPQEYSVYCPKALCGIDTGRMPDTLRSRCIVLTMKRRLVTELVERFYPQDIVEAVEALRADLDAWAVEHLDEVAALRPAPIMELSDRTDEVWRPLLAIAQLAGKDCLVTAREASLRFYAATNTPHDGHALLVALRALFVIDDTLTSKAICKALNADEELPFGDYRDGQGLNPRGLANLLRPYGIKPRNVRVPGATGVAKGYQAEQFTDAWKRYTSAPEERGDGEDDTPTQGSEGNATSATSATSPLQSQIDVADWPDVAAQNATSATQTPDKHGDVADVADVADGREGARSHATLNGAAPELRLPTCRRDEHRPTDWAMPNADMWICGTCHPPPETLRASAALIYRNGGRP